MVQINTDQQFEAVNLTINNAAGEPAAVDGVPVWASSDETVVSVSPGADGMSAVVATVAPGTARVTVSADADLGEGSVPLTGVTEDIEVVLGPSAQASVMTISLGAPSAKAPLNGGGA